MALPKYTLPYWLSTLSSRIGATGLQEENFDKNGTDLKDVKLGRFPVAGHWIDSMADWLWSEKQNSLV